MIARTRGFTLVELLVAISILGMVAVLGWRGLDGIVRARANLTDQMEVTRGMQLTFAQMQNDCEHLADVAALPGRPVLQMDTGRLTIVRTVLVEDAPSGVQVIAYRVVDNVLLRRESATTRDLAQLDILWKAAVSDADTTAPVALQANITGMQLLVWQTGAWRATLTPGAPLQGLQVAAQVKGVEAPMSKAFLLGGI